MARLTVTGDFDPATLTALLGLLPDREEDGVWALHGAGDAEDALYDLLNRLAGREVRLAEALETGGLDGVVTLSGLERVEADDLAVLGTLGCTLEWEP